MVESFFRPCCEVIGESVREQLTGFKSEHILVTGGFGESPYLRKYLQDEFGRSSCKLTILNDGT
jgi:tRNA A37 threonylcarbamoyltransferase TsaD